MGSPLDIHTPHGPIASGNGGAFLSYSDGVPTDGLEGHQPGAINIDTTNGYHYENRGSITSTTWVRVAAQDDWDADVAVVAAGKMVTEKFTIDCSANGTAETAAVITLAAGSVLQNIVAFCIVAFDGDATTTCEIGVSTNTDKYIDPVDFDVTDTNQAAMVGGTNNDQAVAEYISAETDVIVTYTNTASASAGAVIVYVTYTAPIT